MEPQGDSSLPPGVSGVSAPRDLSLERSVRPLLDAVRRITGCDVAFLSEITWAEDAHRIRFGAPAAELPDDAVLADPAVPADPAVLCRRALDGGEILTEDVGDPDLAPAASALVVVDDPARPWGVLCVASSDATPSDATPSDATPSDATPSDATPPDGARTATARQDLVGTFADLIAQRIRDEHAVRDELRAAARDRATLARHTSVLLAAERELLAPLTAARGWAATVLRPDLDHDRRREAGRGLVAQLDALWNRLNGLWGEAHLAVQGPVDRAVIDLAATIRATVARHQPVLGAHDVRLDAAGPVEALGDVDVIADLLARLLDNVNLHTPMNTRVDIAVHADPPRVVVRDHGPGWPEPLPRAPLSTSRPLPLAGTGLFAATGMAESIGATLQAIDVDGPGAALQLTLAQVEDATGWEADGR